MPWICTNDEVHRDVSIIRMLIAVDLVDDRPFGFSSKHYIEWVDRFRCQVIRKIMYSLEYPCNIYVNYIVMTKRGHFVIPVDNISNENMIGYEVMPDCTVTMLRHMLLGIYLRPVTYQEEVICKNHDIRYDVVVKCVE